MYLSMKKRIVELLGTLSDYIKVSYRLKNTNETINECIRALESIYDKVLKDKSVSPNILQILEDTKLGLRKLLNQHSIDESNVIGIYNQLIELREDFLKLETKLNVVILPYKASMWDSLATIYEAADKDNNCDVRVIPIPYYQLTGREAVFTYEGHRFPDHIPITHYDDFDLEENNPDIIFVHNIYDNFNTLTRVDERFFTSNLKKYTNMLVYVPYHISSFILPQKGDSRLAYSIATINNVDRIILAADFLKTAAINEGIPEEKLLVLGSPKFDAMLNTLNSDVEIPEEWKTKMRGKIVYLINTGCLYFANNPFEALEKLVDLFNIARMNDKNVVLWRPHPLTKTSIMKYTPSFVDYYVRLTEEYLNGENPLYENIILDESDDYFPALKVADVLISRGGSLLRSYLLTEKKIMIWDSKMSGESAISPDAFYYAYDPQDPWYKLVKKFAEGHDPLAAKRKNLAGQAYVNVDGTSGMKILENIKHTLLQ